MCTFFSFISDGNMFYYFNAQQRHELMENNPKEYLPDSHSSIAHFYKLDEDKCNKFEYVDGKLIEDQINIDDNTQIARKFMKNLIKSGEFGNICMAAVNQDGFALAYVKDQTPELCMAAVTQNGWALYYIQEQTPKLCMAAVTQNGWALEFVKEQTPDICMAAVQQYGQALEFVKKQTPEICMAAVTQNGQALQFVDEITEEIFVAAVLNMWKSKI